MLLRGWLGRIALGPLVHCSFWNAPRHGKTIRPVYGRNLFITTLRPATTSCGIAAPCLRGRVRLAGRARVPRTRSRLVRAKPSLCASRKVSRNGMGRALQVPHPCGSASPEHASADGDSYDPHHSPLWYLIASAPSTFSTLSPDSRLWIWLTRAPYILFGTLLGASLWYVSRRLYGNAGGYIALGLYCFSPAVIRSSALWVAAAGCCRSLGHVRSRVHRDRRVTYALCSARSRAMELAANCAAGRIAHSGGRLALRTCSNTAIAAGIHALSCP